jgi:transcriptional regulator with XRE-family HTH domain
MDLYEYVGQRIRELRSQHGGPPGISQEVLAQKLDVATNTISRWETATYHPTLDDLDRLARFFGVSLLELLPPDERQTASKQSEEISALLRAAQDLAEEDLVELRRYAEYRRARFQLDNQPKRKRGRPKGT